MFNKRLRVVHRNKLIKKRLKYKKAQPKKGGKIMIMSK